jgi:predicted GIY-YIG superfamily endonuclease
MFYIYFIKSLKNGKVYTGMTEKNPKDRITDHNYGSNKWTKENGPFKILYYERYLCKKDVQNRERFYKTGVGRLIRNSILKVMESLNNTGL